MVDLDALALGVQESLETVKPKTKNSKSKVKCGAETNDESLLPWLDAKKKADN